MKDVYEIKIESDREKNKRKEDKYEEKDIEETHQFQNNAFYCLS